MLHSNYELGTEDYKRHAEALREGERQWREVFEHNPLMSFMVDATNRVLSVNASGASQLGYSADQLVGQSVLNTVFEEDKDFARRQIAACLEALGQSNSWEVRQVRKDGVVLWARATAKALCWSGNQVITLIACEDITEQCREELQLSRLAAIVASSDDAILSKTLDGIVTSWNQGATNIFGYDANEIIGESVTRIIPSELHEEERLILRRLQRGERLHHYETTRIAKDGRRVDVSLTVSPLLDKSGSVVGASSVVRDITEGRRAQAELQQARAELARVARVTTLGALTAAIAHEVNQPLTGLVNSGNACLRWLAAKPPNIDAARQSIERMIGAANRAGEVISRIRALVSNSPSKRERLDINDTISEVIALVQNEIQRNRISLQVNLSNDVPPVLGDRIQLQQVVVNLFLNAIEAMSEVELQPRQLLVASVKDDSQSALVMVRDSGIGLDAAAQDRLFEAFYTTKPQGMGIGLAVSRTIIQAHGGRLWATANQPQGAVFQFSLPAEGEELANLQASNPGTSGPSS